MTPEQRAQEDLAKDLAKLDRVRPSYREKIRQALEIRSRVRLADAKIERDTDRGIERERRKLDALLTELANGGRISASRVAGVREYYATKRVSKDELQTDREWWWKKFVGGDI